MKKILSLIAFTILYLTSHAQQITYSEPEQRDSKSLNFNIIGKIQDHYLIFKNIRNDYSICAYDRSMKLVNRIPLSFLPDKILNSDFISYPDFAWFIYQYQKKNIVYCMAVKINHEGKLATDPVQLDTTRINFFADNKIYGTAHSEDKSKIMIYKIQRKNGKYDFTTLLFNDSLQLQHLSRIPTDFDDHRDMFSDFFVDNEGYFVFTQGNKSSTRDFIQYLALITKAPEGDEFSVHPFALSKNYIDAVRLKIDNLNQHYIISSFYYAKRKGNVEGLYTAVWDKKTQNVVSINFQHLGDSVRTIAKSNGNNRTALNDYFIRDIFLKKDGGFLLAAEDFYSQSRTSPWNRYDYLYGYPSFSPYNYYLYNPYAFGYYNSPYYYNYYNDNSQRYYYNNILVFNMDKTGAPTWVSVVSKSQYDDATSNYLSYADILYNGQVHFLFNTMDRRTLLLGDQSMSGSGEVTRNPPLKSLDRGYQFMPRFGKQVSATEMIIPCTYRNYVCFAKLAF